MCNSQLNNTSEVTAQCGDAGGSIMLHIILLSLLQSEGLSHSDEAILTNLLISLGYSTTSGVAHA